MAQPLAAPDRLAAGAPDGVLATKLHVPPRQAGFVPRPRLVAALDDGLSRALILVCAPAGFGKTALLADWGKGSQLAVAWLSLDAGDSDPARFWRHAIATLDRVQHGIAERTGPLLGPPAPPSFEGLVAGLINEMTSHGDQRDVLLVLDDYHLVESRAVHESLAFLLEHRPAGVHLVLSSREDPPLALARLRGGGQLAELRAADLRFTTEEAAALLRDAVGPDVSLPDAAVATLADRTEGWAAGLQLAALSLRGRPDAAAFLEAFSGSHRYVLDYLTEEVLDRQPEALRTFLLETSVLERLAGPLCDAVTGRTDGQQTLETIERANLFLVPLDEVRGWWRYHHLFADLLRTRLQQRQPDRMRAVHRNAATWCEDHGLADDAVRHALAAGDAAWAARLIERHFDATFRRGEEATVQRWLAALPTGLAGSRARLLLAQARVALLSGRAAGVEDLLVAAERAFADAADEPFEPTAGKAASVLANVPATIALDRAFLAELHGDAERTEAFARQALTEVGTGESILASVGRWHLARAEWLNGRVERAEVALSSIVAQWIAAGEHALAVRGCCFVGQVQLARGHLDAARETYRRALEITAQADESVLPVAGMAHVGMAEVAYQRGELDAAGRHLTDGIALCRQFAYTQPLATGLATLAMIRQAQGDPAGALEAIGAATRVAPGTEVIDLLNPVPALRARLLLVQGDVTAAAGWVSERGLEADDQPSYPREPAYLVLTRALLAQHRPDRALGLLGRLYAAALAQGRTGSVIEVQALRALAHATRGDEEGALDALAEAVTLAAPEGWVQVFVDEGAPMRALLGRLVAARGRELLTGRGLSLAYLSRLGAAIEPGAARRGSTGLIEPLSERELEVLQLVAAGRANREIADELFVTLDTVKKHITHILGKLGATNRTEAAARARELGLVK